MLCVVVGLLLAVCWLFGLLNLICCVLLLAFDVVLNLILCACVWLVGRCLLLVCFVVLLLAFWLFVVGMLLLLLLLVVVVVGGVVVVAVTICLWMVAASMQLIVGIVS